MVVDIWNHGSSYIDNIKVFKYPERALLTTENRGNNFMETQHSLKYEDTNFNLFKIPSILTGVMG